MRTQEEKKEVLAKVEKYMDEICYGSIEVILSGPAEKIDIMHHHRERVFPKVEKFHQG